VLSLLQVVTTTTVALSPLVALAAQVLARAAEAAKPARRTMLVAQAAEAPAPQVTEPRVRLRPVHPQVEHLLVARAARVVRPARAARAARALARAARRVRAAGAALVALAARRRVLVAQAPVPVDRAERQAPAVLVAQAPVLVAQRRVPVAQRQVLAAQRQVLAAQAPVLVAQRRARAARVELPHRRRGARS
jgi:hypothetical protein